MKSDVFRAGHLLATEGFTPFLEKLRAIYYGTRCAILNNYEYRHNGVRLDLGSSVISTAMRGIIAEGRYESEETELIKSHLRPNCDVIELGAGIGYISAVIDRELEPSAEQLSVEADKRLIPILETTKELNDCDYTVINSAYSTKSDKAEFYLHPHFWSSSASKTSNDPVQVDAVTLSNLLGSHGLDDFQLVMDIEGGEVEMIAEELDVLESKCVLLIVEFHDGLRDSTGEMASRLEDELSKSGFKRINSEGSTHVFKNDSMHVSPTTMPSLEEASVREPTNKD